MSWFRMSIKNGQISKELEMDQVGSAETMAVVNGFFGVHGLNSPVESETELSPQTINMAPNITIPITKTQPAAKKNEQIAKVIAKEASPAKKEQAIIKPPLLNSERTLAVSFGEKLEEIFQDKAVTKSNEQSEDWIETGIKHKDGVPHYRCRYWCKNPECRKKGNHYILPDTKTVECHNCGTELEVCEAIEGKYLQKNEWGNFFKADRLASDTLLGECFIPVDHLDFTIERYYVGEIEEIEGEGEEE